MAEPLRHRQTKEAATDMFYLKPPRHISTLPRGEIPVHLIYVSYSIESGLVSMIGMSHFPTGGSIASLTRFSVFLFSSLGPLCPLLSNSWTRAFCAFGTASINSASASLKPEAA